MLKIKIIFALILAIGAGLAAASSFVPVSDEIFVGNVIIADKDAFYATLAMVVLTLSFNYGAVLLFFLGLGGFKTAFRRSYYWICAGFMVQGIGVVAYPASLYLGLIKTDLSLMLLYGEVPLIIGVVMVFYGFYRFGKLLQISSWIMNIWTIASIVLVMNLLIWFLPHRYTTNELFFDIGHAWLTTEMIFYALCAVLAVHIRRAASAIYARSLTWFAAAMVITFFAEAVLLGYDYINYPSWLTADVIGAVFSVSNFMSLVVAYSFNRITRANIVIQQHGNTLLDSIIYLSSLVSRRQEVDDILDRLRVITAAHAEKEPYSPKESAVLEGIRSELIDYLSEKERLRSFSKDQLHSMLRERFGA